MKMSEEYSWDLWDFIEMFKNKGNILCNNIKGLEVNY